MGSFSIWHAVILLVPLTALISLIVVLARSGRNAAFVEKPLPKLATWLTGFVILTSLLSLVSFYFNIVEFNILSQSGELSAEVQMAAIKENFAHLGVLAIFLISCVMISMVLGFWWIHRASSNLWARKLPGLSFSPRGAIGFYFVPILNLFMPYQAMREIWNRSAKEAALTPRTMSIALPIWFFFFITSWIAKLAKNKLNRDSETIDQFITVNIARQIEIVLVLAASVAFLIIVRQITRYQTQSTNHSSSR